MIKPEELRRFALFQNMSDADLQALSQPIQRKSYAANTLLFRKGEPGDTMMMILQGDVRIFLYDEHGNEITLRTLKAGQILGELAVLDRKSRLASATALTPLELLVLQRDDFLRLLRERPPVGIELMRNFAERVRYATHYLERLHDAVELLANNDYDQAIREMSLSSNEDEMRELITAFLAMVHQVRTRENEGK
jgi:CRP-like cAMP-binding protein